MVVDASVALAWCFPDEGSNEADNVLLALDSLSILVPAIWSLEVTNGILVGERSKRLHQPEIQRFSTLLQNLSIIQDAQSAEENLTNVLPLAREYGLSAYDAAYLEISLRHGAPLATLDQKLMKAARRAGARIFSSA
ncbi:MAG: type II toxin-antitoxin system VapC family toxin [Bryobacteraceae bacterium]